MNRSYYYGKIMEKSEELSDLLSFYYNVKNFSRYNKKDLKSKPDEDLLFIYENLKLSIKEALKNWGE